MQLKTYRIDGVTFVANPYRPGISLREDVFLRQFRVECDGQFEYPEDERIWGTYTIGGGFILGERGHIEEAMTLAETRVSDHDFDLSGREDLVAFHPEIISIYDGYNRHVLTGSARSGKVSWLPPVSSAAEAKEVAARVAKLYAEASFERGWDNYSTARGLELDARILSGRLVHPIWREYARAALSAATP